MNSVAPQLPRRPRRIEWLTAAAAAGVVCLSGWLPASGQAGLHDRSPQRVVYQHSPMTPHVVTQSPDDGRRRELSCRTTQQKASIARLDSFFILSIVGDNNAAHPSASASYIHVCTRRTEKRTTVKMRCRGDGDDKRRERTLWGRLYYAERALCVPDVRYEDRKSIDDCCIQLLRLSPCQHRS